MQAVVYYTAGIYERVDRHHVFLMAGGLSFSLLTCLIPFVLIIFAILGNMLELPELKAQLFEFIDTIIPYAESGDILKNIISNRMYEFRSFKSIAAVAGILGTLVAASGLFSSMRTILDSIFAVGKRKHVIVAKLRDMGMVIILILLFLLAFSLLPLLEVVKDSLGKIGIFQFIKLTLVQKSLLSVTSFLVMLLMFFLIYKFVPYARLKKRVVLAAALNATVMWEAAKQLFGFYITHGVTLNRIYGTYVFIIVLYLWIYYSSVVFIISAIVGQLYNEWQGSETRKSQIVTEGGKP